MEFALKPARSAMLKSAVLSSPSSRGDSLLKRGSISFGYKTNITIWNSDIATKAQIHQVLAKSPNSQRIKAKIKTPITSPTMVSLILSLIQSLSVLLLKPNFCSNTNCSYQSKGKSGIETITVTRQNASACPHTDIPKNPVKNPNRIGKIPKRNISANMTDEYALSKIPYLIFSSV